MHRRLPARAAGLSFLGLFFAGLALLPSACGGGMCDEGLTACGDECVDTRSNPQSCGACGNACPSGQSCQASVCVAECSSGLTSCEGSCVDLTSDPANCGACGAACQGGDSCQAGQCVLVCAQPLTNCSDACVDTLTSAQHCGGCDQPCVPGQHCEAGQCACDPGLTLCDGVCVDTQTSAAHCGACGTTCAGASSCVAGSCTCSDATCGVCNVVDIGNTVPQSHDGTTADATDGHAPSCGDPGSREVAYRFVAPEDGTYIFDTTDALFDSVISVRSDACMELGCNDVNPYLGGFDALLSVDLTQGQTVFVVVDGADGAAGPFTLRVNLAQCPNGDLGNAVPAVATGTTMVTGDHVLPSCAYGPNTPDATYLFTAPADDTYIFSAAGSDFPAVVTVLDGGCAGAEIACNNELDNDVPHAIATLTAGQTVLVAVESAYDGLADDFNLVVNAAPTCPMTDLGNTVPQTVMGDTLGDVDLIAPSCVLQGVGSGEETYSFTAPVEADYAFHIPESFPSGVIALYDATCGGQELACTNSAVTDNAITIQHLTAGQTVVVLVEDAFGVDMDYNLAVFEVPACPGMDLGSTVPNMVMDDTTGHYDVLTSSCSYPGSPELTYSFTAPADGTYVFDTAGSSFDTVVSVREATCGGQELECDGGAGMTGQATVQLNMGQTVIVVVEGYFDMDDGPFMLNVSAM